MRLTATQLSFRYPAQEHLALERVDIAIEPGKVTWLTGALGSGTSTLLLTLAGLAPRITGGERSGVVTSDGHDPAVRHPLSDGVAYLGPSPGLQLSGVAKSVRHEVAVGPMNLGWPRDRILEAADRAMERLHVAHLAERAPGALSGGETQRVLIAALLAAAPRAWLLDEPFSALDRASRIAVGFLLRELARDGATVVVSCDDADAMLDVADRVVVMRRGRVALDGAPQTLLAGPALPATGASTTDAATIAAAAQFDTPYPLTTPALLALVGNSEPNRPTADVAVPAIAGDRLLLEQVEFAYAGGAPVLRQTSLRIGAGAAVGLFGQNGAGKSTLLRLAMALEQPSAGKVETLGENTRGRGPEDLAPRVGFLFQQPERQLFASSVRAECAVAPTLAGWDAARIRAATDAVLAELELLDVAAEHPYDLPLPRRRLVALASILVTDPILLLLDEPTAGLDGATRGRVTAAVRSRVARGGAVLAITHDATFAHEALDRGLHLEQGAITFDGPVRDLLNDRDLTRPAALAVALQLGLPIGADRRKSIVSVLTSARRM
ncbi:MAG: ATP-binding cassette domain-containing protein [Gemmatimonadota bacterium]